MTILENYLNYLNEQESIPSSFKSTFKKGVHASLMFGVYTTSAKLAWRAANLTFSRATRKCGGGMFKKVTPGFKVCVARERIKAFQQKISVSKNLLNRCSTAPDPKMCKEKFELEIEKAKNRIQINQNKIKQILDEQYAPIIGAAAKLGSKVAGGAISLIAASVGDKAIFTINRTGQALFSSAVRKCGVYKESTERNLCISKIKLASLNKKIIQLSGLNSKCRQDKNPQKCSMRIQKEIEKAKRDIQIEKDNIVSYKKEIELKKREDEFKVALAKQK
jgi:hypothetical protein